MTELDNSRSEDSFNTTQQRDYMPVLEEVVPVTEDERVHYHKKLRQYFLHGDKTTDDDPTNIAPVLLAPYLRGKIPESDFPILYDHESLEMKSLRQVLHEMIFDIFDAVEAELLVQNLPRISFEIEQKLVGPDPIVKYDLQVAEVVAAFQDIRVNFRESEVFDRQCAIIKTQLLARKATMIGFSANTPFQLLNLQLNKFRKRNLAFLRILKKCIDGLNEILVLHGDGKDNSQNRSDFAGELVSFERIKDMATPVVSSSLPEERLIRLRDCLRTLSAAQKAYSQRSYIIFVTQELVNEFALKKTLNEANLEITSERSCTKAKSTFRKEFREFVQIIAAIRLADLEMNQQYDEDLHTIYFEGFERSYLSDEDIRYFRPLIVVEESRELTRQPKDFLTLLSEGAFVKVLAINRLDEINSMVDHEEETSLELAALAIFRRNACVFQGGSNSPVWLNEVIHKGLDALCPVLWNILFAQPGSKEENSNFLAVKTAIESRYFPHLEYDIESGDDFGSHFNILGNPQPGQAFLSFDQKIKSPSGKETCRYSLTMADFLALGPENLKTLEIIPSVYSNEDLIPVAEYLTVPQDSLAGKIPFIWMVDERNILKRAVIPFSWVRRCRARLDYWYFFQELGGANSGRLRHAIKAAKSEWEGEKKAEIDKLKVQLRAEFDHIRTDDLEQAIKRILNSFLNTDEELTTLLAQSSGPSITSQETNELQPAPKLEPKEVEVKTMVSSDVWVESDECTSCNDCIEALPSVFKYNEDKQAIVHNPKAATYAKIVATAEKCPARCIHPGLPHNTDEPKLEKLIKRAEKFN